MDPLVTIRHLRAAKLCAAGAREWFREQGLSWDEFVNPGLPASVIEATGNPFAQRVAAIARREAEGGR